MVLGRDEQAFGEAPLAPFAGKLDEACGLERIQVIADVLARQAQSLRQAGGRGGFRQGGQDTAWPLYQSDAAGE